LSLTITPSSALYTNPIPDSALTFSEDVTQGRHAITIDFSSPDGIYARDMGTIFQWPTVARTVLNVWQPSITPLDEDRYYRLSFHFTKKSLGIIGWGHAREMNIPYTSTAPINVMLLFDSGAVPGSISIPLPSSGGLNAKTKVTLPPNKWKMVEGVISSTVPFLLRDTDLELKIKSWGSADSYQIVRPFSG
jgi:hypothetical protein